MSANLKRSLIAMLITLAAFAAVTVVVVLAQGETDSETEERGHCWDHYLCLESTPVPTTPPTYCELYPLARIHRWEA